MSRGRVAANIMATIWRAQACLAERLVAATASAVDPMTPVAAGMMLRLRNGSESPASYYGLINRLVDLSNQYSHVAQSPIVRIRENEPIMRDVDDG